jgi:GGDEF domain-containing protein
MLIKTTANLLNHYSSDITIVSRLGGDEFALIVINASEKRVVRWYRNK